MSYIGRPTELMTGRSVRVSKTPQLSSQLSINPYLADSPKRHVTVIVEETTRIYTYLKYIVSDLPGMYRTPSLEMGTITSSFTYSMYGRT